MVDEEKKGWRAEELPELSFVVLGAGRSGLAASRALARRGAQVILADDHRRPFDEKISGQLDELGIKAIFEGKFSYEDHPVDHVIVSPGISPKHALVAEARRRDLGVISEIECGWRLTDRPVVAVTGTNGKTTTTAMITHLLNAAGKNAISCGNIGVALCDAIDRPAEELADAILVVEVSSFQLELIEEFRPQVAALLNLTPDHLDRHGTLEEYLAVKSRITMNQRASDALVLNADDIMVWRLARTTQARAWGFSRRFLNDPGANVVAGALTIHEGGKQTEVCKIADLQIPGRHNEMNALAAAIAARILDAPTAAIGKGLASFEGVEHRIELVNEFRGVQFINDSKATNLDAMEVALRSCDRPVVLICGGRDKDSDYRQLLPLVKKQVKKLVVLGEAAAKIMKAWSKEVPTCPVYDVKQAVARGFACSEPGDVVLFSPACASFDMYKSYEERGRDFKRCVNEFIDSQVS